MEERLQSLLKTVIEEYVATALPVGSQYLVSRYHLDVSSATIRHWFVELEQEGFLTQPHTSGGRIPTEAGFRFYVEAFVQPKPSSKRDRELLQKAATVPKEDGRRLKNVAKALADLSGQATVVGLNEADTFYTGLSQLFTQPEFHNWQQVVSLTEILDRLDETLQNLRKQSFPEPKILLGNDCPFGPGCGVILASVNRGLIGILGPLRMDYQLGFSLIHSALQEL
ncbi:MAG TPA: hypothetical protein VFQ60_01740 [Patescibacteria group bacterium]|nr:hypothetical protein [Patescibacteria group bacterium]